MRRYWKSSLTLLPLLVLRCGFLMLGWGFGSWHSWFLSPPRTALMFGFVISFIVGIALAVNFNPFRQTGSDRKSSVAITLGELGLLCTYALGAFLDHRSAFVFPDFAWLRWLGVAMWLGGEMVRLFALHELGLQYSSVLTIQNQHQLIDKGLYRWVRHPYYLGQILAEPGVFFVLRSPLAILILISSVVFVLKRVLAEEIMLGAHFGQAYETYPRPTWRVLPYVY